MSFPYDYVPPQKYPGLSTDELVDQLCILTQDLINGRTEFSDIEVRKNEGFYTVFMESNGESVAGRTRLAESATRTDEQLRIQQEANNLATADLCDLIRTILEYRHAAN